MAVQILMDTLEGNRRGITKKFLVLPKTLDDNVVKDSLEAVSLLSREPYYLVGGIATQSYLPSSCRRPTSDIDLSIAKPMNYESFKDLVEDMSGYLESNGYKVNTRKGSRSFSLVLTAPEGDGLSIEIGRRNEHNFKDRQRQLERELENSRDKIIEGRTARYRVASTEDIVVPKIVRTINSILRTPDLKGYLPHKIEALSSEIIERRLSRIAKLREEAMISPGDAEIAETLRLVSDIYDIRILEEIVGFNQQYMDEACNDWDTIGNNLELVRKVLSNPEIEVAH